MGIKDEEIKVKNNGKNMAIKSITRRSRKKKMEKKLRLVGGG